MFQVSQSAHAAPGPSVILTAWPTRMPERHKELRGDRARRAEPKWLKENSIPYRNKNCWQSWLRLRLLYGGWLGIGQLVLSIWAHFFHHLFFLALFLFPFSNHRTFTFPVCFLMLLWGVSEWLMLSCLPGLTHNSYPLCHTHHRKKWESIKLSTASDVWNARETVSSQ